MWNSKWDQWYDSLPMHTREWLKKQPVWHDSDMLKAFAVGVVVGTFLSVIF